ncbi:hypothetical protein AMK59_146 [Oryctes borbonicus]|uniref:BAG domain-containing protein n=1 Tax=Oryctes borbonicus TaxID=1629725 RepID=A0A0T6BBR6_9SCAR|nr:hypothetical protein AMK59_146 [Oryctes borbonicus]
MSSDIGDQMDIDPTPSTSCTDVVAANVSEVLPKIDEEDNIMDERTAKRKVTELLDRLEGRVEKLRKEASALEEDKDNILISLDSIRTAECLTDMGQFEQEETQRYLDRIIERCLTVDIKIHTPRDKPQEEALHQINHLIDALVMSLKTDPDSAKEKCVSYMNACSSHHVQGITDKVFENALLGCTLDDQKRIKKRLQGLLSYLERLNATFQDNDTLQADEISPTVEEVADISKECNNEKYYRSSRKRRLSHIERQVMGEPAKKTCAHGNLVPDVRKSSGFKRQQGTPQNRSICRINKHTI